MSCKYNIVLISIKKDTGERMRMTKIILFTPNVDDNPHFNFNYKLYKFMFQDILMLCWSYRPNERPDFIRLLNILDKLPKKRLARSPSHPIHLSRSAESVF